MCPYIDGGSLKEWKRKHDRVSTGFRRRSPKESGRSHDSPDRFEMTENGKGVKLIESFGVLETKSPQVEA